MKVACVILCDKYRRVLICKSQKEGRDHPMNGYWVFPGGKQNEGETLIDTLYRETKEELNLEIGDRKIIHLTSLKPSMKELESIDYYFIEVSDEEIGSLIVCNHEFSTHKWVTYKELYGLDELKSGHFESILKVLYDPKLSIEVLNGHKPKTIDNGDMEYFECVGELRNITTLRSQFIQTGPNSFEACSWECVTVLQQLWINSHTDKRKWIDVPNEWRLFE